MNFVGSGITITGYGTTVVVDMTSIAAASASSGGSTGDDVVRLLSLLGNNINTWRYRYGRTRSIKHGE